MHPRDKTRYLSHVTKWETGTLNPPGLATPIPEDPELQDLTARQYAIYECMRSLVDAYGKFDQRLGPDNARYMNEAQNPYRAAGIMCGTCVFYSGGGCDLVSGEIDAGGLCQYALVPDPDKEEQNVPQKGTNVSTYS